MTAPFRGQIVYTPSGKAREYAELACNLRRGCSHGCLYCYVPQILHMTREDFHAAHQPKTMALRKLELDCAELQTLYGAACPPIHFEFTADPYPHNGVAEDWKLTRDALQIVKAHGLNFTILTKGGLTAAQDLDLYGPGDRFGQTVIFNYEQARAQYEPGAARIDSRDEAANWAFTAGIYTWISLEPVVDHEQALGVIRRFQRWGCAFKIGPLNHMTLPGLPLVDPLAFVGEAVPLLQETGCRWMLKQGAFREAAAELNLPWWGPQSDEEWRKEIGA